MKLAFSKDSGTIILSIDEENRDEDMAKCAVLERLYKSDEWMTLLELLAQAEARYDECVMKVKPQEQSFREVAIHAARKNGFCEAMKMLGKAVVAYQEHKKETKKHIESQIDEMLGQEVNLNIGD